MWEQGSNIYNIFIFESHPMRNRNKYDWSKPFKFVSTKEEFQTIQAVEDAIAPPLPAPTPDQTKRKNNIITPKIDIVPPVTVKKDFARVPPNYIRLQAHLNLPLPSQYELTEVDHTFVKTHEDRYLFRGKRILTADFLQKVMVEMELKAGKDMNLPRSKGWMMAFIEREYKELLQYEQVEQFAEIVYNYWKNRREELKFPLLRLLWKPNADQYNHMLAFRPREREKRSLRRANRVVEDEIVEQLYEEFDVASKIVDRIQLREELKMKNSLAQMHSFYHQIKNFAPIPQFLEELKTEDRVKDKEKIKNFHSSLDFFKGRKEVLQNIIVQDPGNNEVDQKLSIVNFLSTVVFEAEQLRINYEKVFGGAGEVVVRGSLGRPPKDPFPIPTQQVQIKPPPKPEDPQQYIKFSVTQYEDMLIRSFEEDDSPVFHVKPCSDYLQLKRRKVDRYYFGSDDECDTKDLKKNVTASYKKWQNLQHIPRTISATSEN